MLGLIDAELTAARQGQAGDRAPALFVDGGAGHVLSFQVGDQGVDVVAHQEELVFLVLVGRVHGDFGWRQREDQPPMTGVDLRILQHVAQECAVGLGILAVDDDVRAVNHDRV